MTFANFRLALAQHFPKTHMHTTKDIRSDIVGGEGEQDEKGRPGKENQYREKTCWGLSRQFRISPGR